MTSKAQKIRAVTHSPRQQAYLASHRISALAARNQLWEATCAALGSAKAQRFQHLNINQTPKLISPIPRVAFERPEAWNTLMSAYARRGMADEAWDVYTIMRKENVPATSETITTLLHSSANYLSKIPIDNEPSLRVYQRALKLFRWMNAYDTSRMLQKADLQIVESPQFSRHHINVMLKCSSRAGDFENLLKIYKSMNHVGSPQRMVDSQSSSSLSLEDFVKHTSKRNKQRQQSRTIVSVDEDRSELNFDRQESWVVDKLSTFLKKDDRPKDTDRKSFEKSTRKPPGKCNNVRPDAITYTTMLSALARKGGVDGFTSAQAIWKDLIQDTKESIGTINQRRLDFADRSIKESNSKKVSTKKVIKLTEDEYNEYSIHEKAHADAELSFPVVRLEVSMVNAYLLSCKKSEDRTSMEYGLKLANEWFGLVCNWEEFDSLLTEQMERNEEFSCGFVSLFQSDITFKAARADILQAHFGVSPNARSVMIIIGLLESMKISPSIVCEAFKFLTSKKYRVLSKRSENVSTAVVKPDDVLHSHYLRLLINASKYSEAIINFKQIFTMQNKSKDAELRLKTHVPAEACAAMFRACAITRNDDLAADLKNELRRLEVQSKSLLNE